MSRIPTTVLACPSCSAVVGLRGDTLVGQAPRVEGDVLDAARAWALAAEALDETPEADRSMMDATARLKTAALALLTLDLNTDHLDGIEHTIRDWLPTLDAQEALVFGVVALRGLLKRPSRASAETLENAHRRAAQMVRQYRKTVDRLAHDRDRDEWIRAHGSRRLKLILAEGFATGSDAAYRDERLRKERPGWGWAGTLKLDEPRNPPTAAFVILEVAREVAPDAKLAYHPRGRAYFAVESFLGRTATYPASAG